MGARIESHLADVWDDARHQLGGKSFSISEQGSYNYVLLVYEQTSDCEPAYIVKVPYTQLPEPRQRAAYEASVVEHMHCAPEAPPLCVPQLLGRSKEPDAPWSAFTYVPGTVLTYTEIHDTFSGDELEQLGHSIGETILWFSKAVSLDSYPTTLNPPPNEWERVFDKFFERLAATPELASAYPTLGKVGEWLTYDYPWYFDNGAFRPNDIMGHHDLRPGNLAFVRQNGQWRLNGVFDFGSAIPSTREREARHVCLLGRAVARRALAVSYGYFACAPEGFVVHDKQITTEDVAWLWGNMQAILKSVWCLQHDEPIGSYPLKFGRLYPGIFDWLTWEKSETA